MLAGRETDRYNIIRRAGRRNTPMAEEIKQLQALLHEFDGDGTMLLEMEEGGESEQSSLQIKTKTSTRTKADAAHRESTPGSTEAVNDQSNSRKAGTVQLKYGSLIKSIEASSRTTNAALPRSNSTPNSSNDSGENQNVCKNCLRLMFTVVYLIYSKGWVIINTTVIFTVMFIFYSIK